jgi:RNA polymerase sigma-70 factor (ECF subfamily)
MRNDIVTPSEQARDPDLACIEQIRSGDGTGLDHLMARHGEGLHRFIFRHTSNSEDAADIAQETFVRVFQKAGSFKPAASVKTWIYTIAMNLCRDRARRAARVKWVPFLRTPKDDDHGFGMEDTASSDFPGPDDSASQLDLEKAINKVIASLPDNLRATFVL